MAIGAKLITITDVRTKRDVDTSYDETRFNGFLEEIQNNDLQELLGAALWLDFFKATPDSGVYDLLLNGEEYICQGETILYPGLKPYLIWAWLSVLPLEGNLHHTQSGDVSYLRDVTTSPNKAVLNQAKENYKRNMLVEQNKIVQYLNTKSSVYPLWNSTNQTDQTKMQIDFI